MSSIAENPGQQMRIEQELRLARSSREQGNEGRARVCARRAAGWAVESIYQDDQGHGVSESNAYRWLLWLQEKGQCPLHIKQAAERLTTRVDQEFNLPFDEDPIEDAETIVDWAFEGQP
jgi:hypothetical protein